MTTPPPLLEPVELVRPAVAEALPLPEARKPDEHGAGWFTAGQMRAYAATAVAAEQKRWADGVAGMAKAAADNNDLRVYELLRGLNDALYRA